MTANPQQFGADPNLSPELLHETNYAIEVLEKEYPKVSRAKISHAISAARNSAGPKADRWQILQHARRLIGNH